MKTISKLYQIPSVLLIALLSIFALTPAHAQFGLTKVDKLDYVKVTANNYVRAESDMQMKVYIEKFGCFGKLHHNRAAYDVNNQITIRGNRDTYYSFGVFDLSSPLTVELPENNGRYQSIMIVSQNHSIWGFYGPKKGTLTVEKVGSRYALLCVRTFVDPNDEADVADAQKLQDQVLLQQEDIGSFEVPDWKIEEVEEARNRINFTGSTNPAWGKAFGVKEELDPIYWMLGAAYGWGGLPGKDATYQNFVPEQNDGKTAYTLTVKDVPVDAFWSVTLYDDKGLMPINKYNAYSFNNVTSEKNKDGSTTIHFGGDPEQANFLPIVTGWNYIVRLYRPQAEILDGSWTFPKPEAVE
ncbi:MAG: DUF1214 domain-containing protein [Ignavibacteriaceae bacterium]